jgi:DNA invertase Pin-like site-specific DNA recombinase
MVNLARAAAYLRVSTDQQAESGYGLDVQRDKITTWARANGYRITAWHSDEGISGTAGLDGRPGLAGCFRDVEASPGTTLLVYRLDRLSRKLADQIVWTEQLEARGHPVVSVMEPDVGNDEMRDLVRNMLGAISQYERATIVRRMKDGRASKSQGGGYAYGSPAYGQRAEHGELVQDPEQQLVIDRMADERARGASLRDIANMLNTEGITGSRGRPWHPATVSRVLSRLTIPR